MTTRKRELNPTRTDSAKKPVARRKAAAVIFRPGIERETPLLPRIVAECVCAEAANWLDDDRPMSCAPALAARATRLYARNPAFARRMRAPGNMGREWLRSFMRHWLASYLSRGHRRLFERLPSSYCVGKPLAVR